MGDIEPGALGPTMCHEHLLVDQRAVSFREPSNPADRDLASRPVGIDILGWIQWNWMNNQDNLVLDSESDAVSELARYAQAGGRSIIDCTLPGIGRDPQAMARISLATGVNVVMGSGYYVEQTHPASVASMSEDDITQEIIREFTEGVGTSGIRAGSIGEIGSSWPMTDEEAKVFRAAGRAQRELGCALTTHPGRDPDSPLQIIGLLRSVGADLERVVIGHIERTTMDLDAQKRIADVGCYVEFDLFGTEITATFPYQEYGIDMPSDAQRLLAIARLDGDGYGNRILVAHDVGTKHRTRRYGGVGYDHFLRDVVPWMERRGLGPDLVTRLVEDNPRRAFAITV
ncbi:MAG: aryldialkylphosphatase [Chloroflexota bacterium]